MKTWLYALFVVIILLCFSAPFTVLLSSIFFPIRDDFRHIVNTVLPEYIYNSIMLMLGVAVLTISFGTLSAWFIANFDFKYRRVFLWAMMLPMAFPAYVVAFVYAGLFDFAGPVQTILRDYFLWGVGDYWFPEIRSLSGAILIISLVSYPYVYMLSYFAFSRNRGARLVAKSLGYGGMSSFFKVGIPMARPAIAAGVALVLMEALADFGAVRYLAVDTFTTGIYRSWFSMQNPVMASKLACMLLGFIFILLTIERLSRGNASYNNIEPLGQNMLQPLSCRRTSCVWFLCLLPIILGFLLPMGWLIYHSIGTAHNIINYDFFEYALNSIKVALLTVIVVVVIAIVFGFILRFNKKQKLLNILIRITSLGYAVPGAVVAVALLYSINSLGGWLHSDWIIGGSIFTLIFAYSFRFFAIALGSVESGMLRISNEYLWLGRLFGLSPNKLLRKIHIPIISGNVVIAGLFVFVEVVKELPATMIIRPFNFDTLATKAYEYAADERIYDSACPSMLIVLLGMVPVILLSRSLLQR